jgi:hypothetical protein
LLSNTGSETDTLLAEAAADACRRTAGTIGFCSHRRGGIDEAAQGAERGGPMPRHRPSTAEVSEDSETSTSRRSEPAPETNYGSGESPQAREEESYRRVNRNPARLQIARQGNPFVETIRVVGSVRNSGEARSVASSDTILPSDSTGRPRSPVERMPT